MDKIVNIINSEIFVNICGFFSALGTMGAVIVSLYVLFKQNKIDAKMTSATIDMVPFECTRKNLHISGYSVTICNLSSSQNIYLKQGLYLRTNVTDEKNNKLLLFIILPEIIKIFPFKNIIGPGEEYTFFLSEKQIKTALSRTKSKNLKFYFVDKFNRKYNIAIKRTELEKRLDYIAKNGDKIVAL